MTIQKDKRRRSSDSDRHRLADWAEQRRFNRHWRQPAIVHHWPDLPLFREIAPICPKPSRPSGAVRHVQALCGLSQEQARLIAELAGFNMEDEA